MLDHLSYQSVLILVFFHFLSALSWSSVLFNLSLCFCHSTPLSLYILPYTPLTSSPVSLTFFSFVFLCVLYIFLSFFLLPLHVPPISRAFSSPPINGSLHASPYILAVPIPFTLFLLSPSSFACSAVGSWDGATMCSTGDGTG